MSNKPRLELDRNNANNVFIGVTEFDDQGYGVRSYVLSSAGEHTADDVMLRRFRDMERLMGDNVETLISHKFWENYQEGPKT